VLIAGLGGKGTSWRPFLARAAERHRVLTFDLRGSGRADPIDGGTTIRALAAEVLERLVLVSTSGRCDPHPSEVFLLWARMAELGVPPEIRHKSSMLWCLGADALSDPAGRRAYLLAQREGDRPADYAAQSRACAAHAALDRLHRLRAPTLVVAGGDDRLPPLAHAEALAQAIPGAELEVIPGAGHLPYLESPDRFAERALAFLAAGTSKGEFACRRPTS
jgi:pimeloyl-ACP methyl ester carboxylesterase